MLSISYDPIKDLQNWLRIKEKHPETFRLTEFYPFAVSRELNQDNLEKIAATISPDKLKEFDEQALKILAQWPVIKSKVISDISRHLNMPVPEFDLAVNLTTAYYMPYDFQHKWFMIPTHKNLDGQMKCFIHELFHLCDIYKNGDLPYEEKERRVEKFLIEYKY